MILYNKKCTCQKYRCDLKKSTYLYHNESVQSMYLEPTAQLYSNFDHLGFIVEKKIGVKRSPRVFNLFNIIIQLDREFWQQLIIVNPFLLNLYKLSEVMSTILYTCIFKTCCMQHLKPVVLKSSCFYFPTSGANESWVAPIGFNPWYTYEFFLLI